MSIFIPISPSLHQQQDFKLEYTPDQLPAMMKNKFPSLSHAGDVSDWMDLCRTSRQPQLLWYVDYIEPKPLMREVVELIKQSEILLYGDGRNLNLLPGYTADISQEIAFHTIRMHLRAEEEDFETAQAIMDELLDQWYDRLTHIRQSNLLVHGALLYLCMKKLQQSHSCCNKHWILLKYLNPTDRIEYGIWDNEVLLQMAIWFFCKHDKDCCDFYATQNKLTSPSQLWRHKKIPILNFLDYDHSWIVAFCSLPIYNYARSLMPSLPPYEKKSTTPVNRMYYLNDQEHIIQNKANQLNLTGWQKYYFERYNYENRSDHVADLDVSDSYLFSYLHFETDYDADMNSRKKLISFLKQYPDIAKSIHNVVDIGCGMNRLLDCDAELFSTQNIEYIGVDIAEYICNLHHERGNRDVLQASASTFFANTHKHYDMCFVNDLLPYMSFYHLAEFLAVCSKKVTYLIAGIELLPKNKENILVRSTIPYMTMHKSLMESQKWLETMENNFIVLNHYTDDTRLLVCAKSKQNCDISIS